MKLNDIGFDSIVFIEAESNLNSYLNSSSKEMEKSHNGKVYTVMATEEKNFSLASLPRMKRISLGIILTIISAGTLLFSKSVRNLFLGKQIIYISREKKTESMQKTDKAYSTAVNVKIPKDQIIEDPSNKILVLALIQQNGLLLEHASDELKKDHAVALSAIKQNINALKFISPELLKNKQFITSCTQQIRLFAVHLQYRNLLSEEIFKTIKNCIQSNKKLFNQEIISSVKIIDENVTPYNIPITRGGPSGYEIKNEQLNERIVAYLSALFDEELNPLIKDNEDFINKTVKTIEECNPSERRTGMESIGFKINDDDHRLLLNQKNYLAFAIVNYPKQNYQRFITEEMKKDENFMARIAIAKVEDTESYQDET